MQNLDHCHCLEQMYVNSPCNVYYQPSITIEPGRATVKFALRPDFCHAAGAIHGSVYFKALDDAAFFATNSMVEKWLVLTVSFTTYLTRPVTEGFMRAVGEVANQNRTQFIAQSVVYNADGREIGRGNGLFVRSKIRLTPDMGYRLPQSD